MSLIFAITGTLVLYFLSTLTQPIIISLQEVPVYEGKQVVTEGVVTEYYETQYKNQLITIKENNSTAIVFLEEAIHVEYGDTIQATGKVQKYKDKLEIITENKKDVKILQKWTNISFPLWQLAQNPTQYLGINVNITGQVDAVFDDYFQLKDNKNNNMLIVFFNTNPFLYRGKNVFVCGKFLFDEQTFRYILVVSEEKHGVFLKMGE